MTISKAPAPANWKKWQFMLSCILWDACCLTFNFEPDHGGLNRNVLHDWLARKRLPNNFPADFADRLLILTSNFKTNVGGEVSLSNIAEFCLRCEWQIPDEMKALIKLPATVAKVPDNETRVSVTIAAPDAEKQSEHTQPLTTKEIAQLFDGIQFTQERWVKNLGHLKWLASANRGKGQQGGASATWCPLTIAQLVCNRDKDRRAKQKTLSRLNSRFRSNPILNPWKDAWDDYYGIFAEPGEA